LYVEHDFEAANILEKRAQGFALGNATKDVQMVKRTANPNRTSKII
jgi:hypothetical protein